MKKRAWSNKPSQMLLEALEDLETVELMENVKIDMSDWCSINPTVENPTKNTCSVCAAGSVMLNRIGIKTGLTPSAYDTKTENKLRAIDSIRKGSLFDFYENLQCAGITVPSWFYEYTEDGQRVLTEIPDYVSEYTKKGREKYKNYIQGMIGILQAEGF